MDEDPELLDEQLVDLKKKLGDQEKRLKEKALLLQQMQNSANISGSNNRDSRSVDDEEDEEKSPQTHHKLSSSERKKKKKGFRMYSPARKSREGQRTNMSRYRSAPSPTSKRTFKDDLHNSHEFIPSERTLSYSTMLDALEANEPEDIFVVKRRKKKKMPSKILLSKDEQYRNQVNLLNRRFHTLGPFVMNLLAQVFKEDELADTASISKDGVMEKVFLCSERTEISEKARWLDSINRNLVDEKVCPTNMSSSDLFFLDQISDKLYEVIGKKCTFNMSLFKRVEPHICIIGPRESGKTTILHLLARSIMDIYLNETNQWHTCFCWIINWKNVAFPSLDVTTFYRIYITKILRQIGTQKPAVAPYIRHLEKLMNDFSKGGSVPQSFSNEWPQEYLMLRIFREKVVKLVKEQRYNELLGFVCTLPYQISQVFGFRSILNVYDNFDYSFVKLKNSDDDSTKSTNYLSVYLKHVMMEQNYIFTGKDMKTFVKSLKIVRANGGSPKRKGGGKKRRRRRMRKSGSSSLNSSLNTSLNTSGEFERMEEDVNDIFMKSTILHTEQLVDPEEVEDLPKAITLVNTNLYTDYKQTQMISIDNFRGCPAYLAHVIRFVQANPSTSEIMNSTPIPEREAKKILTDIIDHKNTVGDVQDQRHHLMKSLQHQ